ncbi:hypothetical protein ACQ4PT_051340 [Festuca glaucescens]
MAAEHDDAVASICGKKNTDGTGFRGVRRTEYGTPEAWTEFRGVQRRLGGKYGAQIGHSKAQTWLGSFDTAEDAARAYDAAAVRLHGAPAKTNFKAHDGVGVQAVGLEKAARSGFRGVRRHRSGRYSARIWDSVKRARLWLGTFDKAEDAARAFDAAAVRLHGERAITNFKQPLVDLNDFPELPALDFSDSMSGSHSQAPATTLTWAWSQRRKDPSDFASPTGGTSARTGFSRAGRVFHLSQAKTSSDASLESRLKNRRLREFVSWLD